jgi:hypothetical protein
MSDDYLWNRTGEKDPEVARLESLLGTLGRRRRPLDLDHLPAASPASVPTHWTRLARPLAAAAVLVLTIGGLWYTLTPRPSAWTVEGIAGTPVFGSRTARQGATVPLSTWVETDARSSLRLGAAEVGLIEVGPGTRVRIFSSRTSGERFNLERGLIHAVIWTTPGRFSVETPAATAVDLGCSYSLEVDGQGTGVLRVTAGWVGVERDGRESLVPTGAVCVMRQGRGPGTPRFEDATRAFADALDVLDRETSVMGGSALDAVLAQARPRDAMTLWHLLGRADRPTRQQIFDRLSALASPPPALDRNAALAGDRAALDAWWNSFGLGDVALFRKWRMQGSR